MFTKTHSTLKIRALAVAMSGVVLTGCASFSSDGGMQGVSLLTKARTGQIVERDAPSGQSEATREAISQALGRALAPDDAVKVALMNNRGLQASLAELGVAEADLVQAGRLRNPGFSFGRMRGGDDVEIDRSVMFDLVGLLTLPLRSGIERGRFEQAKLQAASQAVALAAETRRAYFTAVAARQSSNYAQLVLQSAEAGAELAERMRKAGNWSKLDQMREQAFYADAASQLARARHHSTVAGERLARLMGLSTGAAALQLPDRLPDLPAQPKAIADSEAVALQQRLDIQMSKRDTEATAKALGLTRATGFINVLDAGYANKSETGAPRQNGYEISLELPIFDWGGARVAKAQALYMQAVHRTADTAVRARSEVRESYSAYRTSYDLAKHQRDEVVPLRKKISDEVLLRYNGMLASVFELLADAREQSSSVNTAIEAQRDFWLAETDLQAAINGSGNAGGAVETRAKNEAPAAARAQH